MVHTSEKEKKNGRVGEDGFGRSIRMPQLRQKHVRLYGDLAQSGNLWTWNFLELA